MPPPVLAPLPGSGLDEYDAAAARILPDAHPRRDEFYATQVDRRGRAGARRIGAIDGAPVRGAAPLPAEAPLGRATPLLQVVLQLAAPRRVAELAQGLGLDLADAFAGDVELLAHFLKGAGPAVLQPKAQL